MDCLKRLSDIFAAWLVAPCFIKFRKPHLSKFEQRVKACLLAHGIPEDRILHEVTLPIRVTFEMRKYLDAAGIFQRNETLELRIDMAFEIEAGGRLVLVEVDGSQHSGSHRSWNRSIEDIQRSHRRDAIKHAILTSSQVSLIRVGSEFELARNSPGLFKHMQEQLELPATHHPCPPPPCITLNLVPPFCTTKAPASSAPASSAPAARGKSEPRMTTKRLELKTFPSHDPIVRTRFNRKCKEFVLKNGERSTLNEHMELLRDRQTASDTRKRPRDDTGFDYTLRWWKLCDHWWTREQRKGSRKPQEFLSKSCLTKS